MIFQYSNIHILNVINHQNHLVHEFFSVTHRTECDERKLIEFFVHKLLLYCIMNFHDLILFLRRLASLK